MVIALALFTVYYFTSGVEFHSLLVFSFFCFCFGVWILYDYLKLKGTNWGRRHETWQNANKVWADSCGVGGIKVFIFFKFKWELKKSIVHEQIVCLKKVQPRGKVSFFSPINNPNLNPSGHTCSPWLILHRVLVLSEVKIISSVCQAHAG